MQDISYIIKDEPNQPRYQIVQATQTQQGILLLFVVENNATDISEYLCECIFDFYIV